MSLRRLKITHAYSSSKQYTLNMCKWIRRIVSHSPLECLEIICDDRDENHRGPHISYDGLIDHLVSRHSNTLRVLLMRDAFVGTRKLKLLTDTCRSLEVISVSARKNAYVCLSPSLYIFSDTRLILRTYIDAVEFRRLTPTHEEHSCISSQHRKSAAEKARYSQ